MPSEMKVTILTLVIAVATLLVAPAAYSQSLSKRAGSHAPPPEARQPVDEKAYNAALDRIPTPKQGYDPWGQMRPPESSKKAGKSN